MINAKYAVEETDWRRGPKIEETSAQKGLGLPRGELHPWHLSTEIKSDFQVSAVSMAELSYR